MWDPQVRVCRIRILDFEERVKAMRIFLDVPGDRYTYPGHIMVITREQLEALERAKVAFEYLVPAVPNNGQGTASGQS